MNNIETLFKAEPPLTEVKEEHGEIPVSKYFDKKREGLPQRTAFYRVFGSWRRALAAADLI